MWTLAPSEDRDQAQPYQVEPRYPAACERYMTAFEACGTDALELSEDLADSGRTSEGSALYIHRQLLQLRRELAAVRASGGEQALLYHCQSAQFSDINYRLVRQMASSLLLVNAMRAPCAKAVSAVIRSYNDPNASAEATEATELSNTVATIAATPNKR